ncbi:MAG: peptidyl-prolyl cis-trans isomerase [Cyanobium sp.]
MGTSLRRRLAGWLAEPLLQFLLIGSGLFALHALVSVGQPRGEIRVSPGQVETLAALFRRTWQRPPSRQELQGLVDDWIREEAAVREARALGLDQDDPIIRRRLRQKLEFLAEERADRRSPGEAELQTWLREHPDRYRRDPRYSFQQVALDPARGPEPVAVRAQQLLAQLNGATPPADAGGLGDPLLLLEPRYEALPASEVTRLFGGAFAGALAQQRPGRWLGPLRSGYGLHLVKLEAVTPGSLPPLAEVREAVERDWRQHERRRERDAEARRLVGRYRVERPPLPAPAVPR